MATKRWLVRLGGHGVLPCLEASTISQRAKPSPPVGNPAASERHNRACRRFQGTLVCQGSRKRILPRKAQGIRGDLMGIMVSKVYEALIEAGASVGKAKAALEAIPLSEQLTTKTALAEDRE